MIFNIILKIGILMKNKRIYSLFKNDKSEIIREDENKIYYIIQGVILVYIFIF